MDFDIVSRVLFPAPPSSYTVDSFPGELIWIPRSLNPQTSSPEDCIPCCLLRSKSAQYLVIYLHSNYEDIGRAHTFLRHVRDCFQVHVLAVEYPGYGICPGAKCDERGATESALTAFRFSKEVLRWSPDRIIFLGRSVGTGPAITLAVEHAVKGICLISPFLSVREVCKDALGPISYLIEERFPNKDHMPLVRSPCLVIHGLKDTIIPYRHGRELFESCRTRKRLVSPPEMDHNANLLQDSRDFVLPMLEFFSLPACGLEEMQVPSWAFDKRLSPFYLQRLIRQPKPAGLPPSAVLGSCTACTACSNIGSEFASESMVSSRRWDGDAVEETITGAVERVLEQKKDFLWSESSSPRQRAVSPRFRTSSGVSAQGYPVSPIEDPMSRERSQLSLPLAAEFASGTLPMGEALMNNFSTAELPLPPCDDAVPVVPHATVRRQAGRDFGDMFVAGGVQAPGRPAAPMMSWRPQQSAKILDPGLPVQPKDMEEDIFDDFNDADDDFPPEHTLIQI